MIVGSGDLCSQRGGRVPGMPQAPKTFWEDGTFWERVEIWEGVEIWKRVEIWEGMFNRLPLYFLIQRTTVFVYMVIFTIWYIHSRL